MMKKILTFSSLLLGIGLFSGCGQQMSQTLPTSLPTATEQSTSTISPRTSEETTALQIYSNTAWGFKVNYPN